MSRGVGYHAVLGVSPSAVMSRDVGCVTWCKGVTWHWVSRGVACHAVLGVTRCVDYVLFLAVMCQCFVE